MAGRTQSIRTKITVLLAVPLASLVGLWIFASTLTFSETKRLLDTSTIGTKLVFPVNNMITALKNERRGSVTFLAGTRSLPDDEMRAQRSLTDAAVKAFQRAAGDESLAGSLEARTRGEATELAARVRGLQELRTAVDGRTTDRTKTLAAYSSYIDHAFTIYGSVSLKHREIVAEARTILTMARAHEYVARADALMTGVLAAGRMNQQERAEFGRLAGAHRLMYADVGMLLTPDRRARFDEWEQSGALRRFHAYEDRILGYTRSARPPLAVDTWRTATDEVLAQLANMEADAFEVMMDKAQGIAMGVLVRLGLAGGLGLIAVITSGVLAWRIALRLVRESRRMARELTRFTTEALPELAAVVRAGGRPADTEPVADANFKITEIDQINQSFVTARRAIVESTVREIAARRGISEIFVNLARRSQALLHRQLSMLDGMQRRAEDPAELEDLFRLDHLATRMRRHAEGLVILAGKPAGRAWRNPVPLIDVIRGAVAEVEDYTRVRVLPMSDAALTGTAVADTIHLLAELIENATLYSPPQSQVSVSGQPVPNGFVIEVEDRGLGLKPETLAEINQRLAEPPEFDISDMGRLGLFVVAQLARRHGIQVALRTSPYGGTTAIVLLPAPIIVAVHDPATATAAADRAGAAAAMQDAASVNGLDAAGGVGGPGGGGGPLATPAPALAPAGANGHAGRPGGHADDAGRAHAAGHTGAVTTAADDDGIDVTDVTDADDEMFGGLPRRRRQASLVPQLRDADPPQEPVPPAEPDLDRPPEEIRNKMAAMQSGWRRGRVEAVQEQARPGTEEDI